MAMLASLAVFFLKGKKLETKLKFGVIALAGVLFLAMLSYHNEAVRVRWEKTFYDENLAVATRSIPRLSA